MSPPATITHRILGTAGHVDHGKSALIKACTGVDPDRLPEEKSRGMTIDLGFAHMDIPSRRDPNLVYSTGIVDVPGHTDFINNMVTGIGAIDIALMTVAADDGWMPQSEEHLQILSYLGIERLVVALTKRDRVDDIEPVKSDVRDRLQNSPFSQAPLVPVSVMPPDGLDELRAEIGQALDATPAPADIGKPRLAIDRTFTRPGTGTIVTGTLTGGSLTKNQKVLIQPSGLSCRIRSIQSHNQGLKHALPGMRCALNLGDIAIASRKQQGVARGDVVTLSELGPSADTFNVCLSRAAHATQTGAPLKHGARVRWHHGGVHAPARIYLPECNSITDADSALAQVRLESPHYAFCGDRFILRNLAGTATLAGGTVLEPNAVRKGYRRHRHIGFLRQWSETIEDPAAFIRAILDRDLTASPDALLKQSHFNQDEIDTAIEQLRSNGDLHGSDLLIQPAWWQTQQNAAALKVDRFHIDFPEREGMPLNEIRSHFNTAPFTPALAKSLIAQLCESAYVQDGTTIRHRDHAAKLPPHLEAARAALTARLRESPFSPPSRKALTEVPNASDVLKLMLDRGEAVAVGHNLVFLREHYDEAIERAKAFLQHETSASLSQLREALQTSRRVMVPLAEHMDREGITTRQGDARIMKRK